VSVSSTRIALPAAVLVIVLAGCGGNGGGSGGSASFACDQPFGPGDGSSAELCLDYVSLTRSADPYRQLCTSGGGTILAACPTANRVGCCTATVNGIQSASCYYAPADSGSEKQTCVLNGGVWSDM
jgi:hypothetical protein